VFGMVNEPVAQGLVVSLQHVPTGVNRDSQGLPEVRV
jgi:hypothetical protein